MTDDRDAPTADDSPIDRPESDPRADRTTGRPPDGRTVDGYRTDDGEVELGGRRGDVGDRKSERDESVGDDAVDRRRGYASETDLADELGRIDVMTTPDGYVEGRITDLETVDETTVEVVIALPHGETVSFPLEKPIPWSREFLLARIVEDVGYDAASIDHVVGEPVYLQRTDLEDDTADTDDWWVASLEDAGDALLSSLSGGRYRLEHDTAPEWRLVDPLERPDPTTDDSQTLSTDFLGGGLVLLGTLAPLSVP
ncbi:hypothetical protein [Halobiforma nitratireducens]|uniref:Uncharacterized protein n=1 Tax=Halobiforma nitratireducens JCM 10879 TaxID=1227454 RepID=M0LVC3_9EURY|nr:hypothetical protein C446_11747 [Halobiforma nitratireducens JCM 10879]